MLKWLVLLAVISTSVGILQTGITKCFQCDRGESNDDCNGAHLDPTTSPHGNGTLHTCLLENPTCYFRFFINQNRTGYRIQKGCMDLLECLTTYAWQWDDWNQMSCFNGNPELGAGQGLVKPAEALTECLYCCTQWQQGYTDGYFDGCNDILPIKIPMPSPNEWDDDIDDWPDHPERIVQVEPDDHVPADWGKEEDKSAAWRPQFGFALSTMASVFVIGSALVL